MCCNRKNRQAPPHIIVSGPAATPTPMASTTTLPPPPDYTTAVSGLALDTSAARARARSASQSSLSSQATSLPGYDDEPANASPFLSAADVNFCATAAFQIQSAGKGWISFPGPTRPDPIPVYAVRPGADADVDPCDMTPKYVSLRNARRSGNCVLIRGDEFPEFVGASTSPSSRAELAYDGTRALASTLYRFGCGRPPQIRVYPGDSGPSPLAAFETMRGATRNRPWSDETEAWALDSAGAGEAPAYSLQDLGGSEGARTPSSASPSLSEAGKAFTAPLNPTSSLSRAIRFATPQGTFQWRYSTRPERKAFGAHSLLVLEHLVPLTDAAPAGAGGRAAKDVAENHVRVPVGYFIRSRALRSPGTNASTAGNGGRLLLDLRVWDGASDGSLVDEKRRLAASDATGADAEAVERVAIITCLAMLKKEVDRRRTHQMIILAAGASGGP